MMPRVVVVTQQMVDEALVRQMAPVGFELAITRPDSPDWADSLRTAEYLVGFVDMLVREPLYCSAPHLKLIQLLSAGNDRADIARLSEAAEDALDVRFRLFHELLETSDIVLLHVPLNDSTRGLIGASELARMKTSAMLVNTSRGAVADEAALHRALASRQIAGAGLDVFEIEPPATDNPLFLLDNVVLTAHMAGPTQESNPARLRNAFDNVQRVARGESPLWVIAELDA